MKAIKNFDENVYVLQDESGNYHIKINGKVLTQSEASFLVFDINRAIDFIKQKDKELS